MPSPSSSEPPDRERLPVTSRQPARSISGKTGGVIVRILVGLVVTAIIAFGLLVGFCALSK